MINYRINTDKLVNILTPIFFRGENNVKFVQSLLKPLQTLNDNFILEANERRIQANMTSQVMLFEWYLNYKFNKYFWESSEKIVLIHSEDLSESLFYESELSPEDLILFYENELQSDPDIRFEGELSERLTESFWVSAPKNSNDITEEDYRSKITNEIEKYRLAGKTYLINIKKLFSEIYYERVVADGGLVEDIDLVQYYYEMSRDNSMAKSIMFSYLGEAGSKLRTSGIYNYVEKTYSTDSLGNDAVQTTELSQPYESGNIAPNENNGMKNPNGDSRYITHPEISFAAGEPWSVTTCLSWDGELSAIFGGSEARFQITSNYLIQITPTGGVDYSTTNSFEQYIGKNIIITFSSNGSIIDIYVNGIFIESINSLDAYTFSYIMRGRSIYLSGTINAHIIRSQALTAEQVLSEAEFLLSIYPEIPSVKIGEQTFSTSNLDVVATPIGTIIPNVIANSNVEKITNSDDRDFTSDTGWWGKATGVTVGSGVCSFSSVAGGAGLDKTSVVNTGKWYKVTYTILNYSIGGLKVRFPYNSIISRTSNGTYVEYGYSESANIFIQAIGTTTLDIDNISVEEIGWAGSQDLYDGLIAQGEIVYDATKAASMWAYYDNDSQIGSTYGKLYNWFSASLIQQDIDLYNVANPDNHWGYHIPSQAEFTTLQTELGVEVAGGKMKVGGFDYWNSPNEGATNWSGFSALGGGYRAATGVFSSFLNRSYHQIYPERSLTTNYYTRIDYNFSHTLITWDAVKMQGASIRLIKD